jgi:tight adherence protein C
MLGSVALTLVTFVGGTSLILLVCLLLSGRNQRVEGRIQNLKAPNRPSGSPESGNVFTRSMLPKLGTPLLPTSEEERSRLRGRLIHSGLYSRQALVVFLGVKMILMVLPLAVGLLLGLTGLLPFSKGLLYGLIGSCVGMLAPNLWLDRRKKKRQACLRRSLPDALDMVIVCLKGGLSLQGAFQRVTAELGMVHPMLAGEFSINQREIQLGRSTGEAMKHFAERCDLEEIRSLSGVLLQAERLGASSVQALRTHAETLRLKRLQRAEEIAHTAGTKMIFPTILCIFPAILLVVLGPAAFQIADLFSHMK